MVMAKSTRVETVPVSNDEGSGELPRYDDDYLRFVLQELPSLQPCTVPDFVKRLGFVPRPRGNTGRIYRRFLAAFEEGLRAGKLSKNGWNWRVVGVSAPLRVAS
jgi:hypothetical protein